MTLGEFRKETANLPDDWKLKMLTEEGEYVADVNTVDIDGIDGNEVLLVE